MLTTKKSAWFEKIFAIYCRNLFKRRFHHVSVSHLDLIRCRDKPLPLVIYCNHSSWWDGLVAFQISQKLKLDSFLLMEEKQLKNRRLFRKLGAFSVIRENRREAVKSINYAAILLKEQPGRTLWIFPQGEILPNETQPLRFFNGISRIIERTGKCNAVPMAIRYEFLGEFKPEVLVKFGKVEAIEISRDFASKKLTEHFGTCLIETLDFLKSDIAGHNIETYERLI